MSRQWATAVYADPGDAAVREDPITPRLELRHVERGDPAGTVPRYLDILPTPEWMADAACVGEDPRMFSLTDKSRSLEKDGGREICAGCPVAAQCFEYGMGDEAVERRSSRPGMLSPWESGLWGGALHRGDPSRPPPRTSGRPVEARRRRASEAQVAARLRELRRADPGWPNMQPSGRKVDARHWPTHDWSNTQRRRQRHLAPVPSMATVAKPITPRDAMWHDIDREYVAQGRPDIVPTRWGVFISTLDGGWPDGILVTLPITEDDLTEVRRTTGRSLPWDEATVTMVENAVRAKAANA